MRCTLEIVALHRLSLLGEEPKPEEVKKWGRISTVIPPPPPHISKDVSHNQDDVLIRCDHVADCPCCPVPNELSKPTIEFTKLDPHIEDCTDEEDDNNMASSGLRLSFEHSTSSDVAPVENTSDCTDRTETQDHEHSTF